MLRILTALDSINQAIDRIFDRLFYRLYDLFKGRPQGHSKDG